MTLPLHDDMTRYISSWSEKILLTTAERIGIKTTIAKGENATKSHLMKNIESKNPKFVFLNGHGSSTSIGGHNNEEIISLGENEKILENRIVHVLACDAGKDLGEKCGARAFIGYKGKFWLCMNRFYLSRPLEDPFASPVMVSAMEAPDELLKGTTPKEAFESSQNLYSEQIDEFTHSESKYTTEELQLILPVLNVNRFLQVLHEKDM